MTTPRRSPLVARWTHRAMPSLVSCMIVWRSARYVELRSARSNDDIGATRWCAAQLEELVCLLAAVRCACTPCRVVTPQEMHPRVCPLRLPADLHAVGIH